MSLLDKKGETIMMYVHSSPDEHGAYTQPQSIPFSGCLALSDEQAATLVQYNGFVTITSYEEPIVDDFTRTVYEVEPNLEAWEAWKASLPPEPEPEPTDTEVLNTLLGVSTNE